MKIPKFRVWSIRNGCWAYKLCLYLDDSKIGDVSEAFHNEDDASDYVIEPATTIKDIFDNDIYDGDIVKIIDNVFILSDGQKEDDARYLVEWVELGFKFTLQNGSYMQGCGRMSNPKYEIMGNIHEGSK